MATLVENAAEVANLASAIDAAITTKGGTLVGGGKLRNAAAGIASIPSGGNPTALTVMSNGTYTNQNGYSPVTVDVTDLPCAGFPDIRTILANDDPVADGKTTTVFSYKMIWLIDGNGATLSLPNGYNFRMSDGTYIEGTSGSTWTVPSTGLAWIISYFNNPIHTLDFRSTSKVGSVWWVYAPSPVTVITSFQGNSSIIAVDCDLISYGNLFYNCGKLKRVRGSIGATYSLQDYATLSLYFSSLIEMPKMIDVRNGRGGNTIGGLNSGAPIPIPRKMFCGAGSISISGCYRPPNRDDICVIEDGIATDTKDNPSFDYGFINNVNTCTWSGTITLSSAQQALFTEAEWTAMTTMLTTKGWSLSPAWPSS